MSRFSSCRGVIALSICFMLFTNCSRIRPRFEDLPLPDTRVLLEHALHNRQALHDFSGSGVVKIRQANGYAGAVGLRLQFLEPNSLSLILKGPMGIQIATLVMEGDYYSLNIGNSNSRVTGKIVDLDFYQNFGLNLRSSDLITLFLPLFNIAENPENASLSRELTTEQYCLSWADSQQVHQVWADPLRPVFLRELVSSQSGDTIRYREIEDVKKRSGVYFPSSWEVRFGQGTEAVSLELDFAQIKVNSGLSRTDFHLDIENVQDSVEVNLGQ